MCSWKTIKSNRINMKKKNEKLTSEQKIILFEEGTEPPGSSELNYEKREGT